MSPARRLFLAALVARLQIGAVAQAPEGKESLLVRAWRGPRSDGRWPEDAYLPRRNRAVGICISGGGSRSYTAAMGQLRALHDLGLLRHPRHLVGVSGGSWAVAAFTYAQADPREVPDEVLLGDFWQPEEISWKGLHYMDNRSARAAVTRGFYAAFLEDVASTVRGALPPDQVWETTLSRIFLEPLGIPRGSLFTWNRLSLLDVLWRNPPLRNRSWVLPRRPRPYPVIETSFLGPYRSLPSIPNYDGYVLSEVTPLYAGRPHASNITYWRLQPNKLSFDEVLVGGLVEPAGYGRGAPASGLAGEEGLLRVPAGGRDFPLARAISQSSLAPALLVSEIARPIVELLGDHVNYWAPTAEKPAELDMAVGDGGDVDNLGLMSMLRRQVESIVLFVNSITPLVPREHWDPRRRLPGKSDIGDVLPGYFGIFFDLGEIVPDYDYRGNQVFAKEDFTPLAVALQDSQAQGCGAVASVSLTTVENKLWGIPAGIRTQVTVLYLSRAPAWEARLPPDVREFVVPEEGNASDPSVLRRSGPFLDFPHFSTSRLELSAEQANLLATLSGSVVFAHAETLRRALDPSGGSLASDASSASADAVQESLIV